MIGMSPEEHKRGGIEAYESVGIECLVLWENDVIHRWEEIREGVGLWIQKAIEDINQDEKKFSKKVTKPKIDKRLASYVAEDGSEKKFKSKEKLEKWLCSEKNLYREGLEENIDYVVCKECGKRYLRLGRHLKSAHKIDEDEYNNRYPDVKVICDKDSERVANENKSKKHNGYKQRVVYRCPDGRIVKKRDAWRRFWGIENPPIDSIIKYA
jgi:hypothetical protein